VEIHVITAPVLRLDHDRDRTRCGRQSGCFGPGCWCWILGATSRHRRESCRRRRRIARYLRTLQRELGLSVLLVHHTRKNAADGVAAGQGLRGSGDIHAFGDSNLYLQRTKEQLILSSEHRAAPAAAPVYLELVATDAETTHLEVTAAPDDDTERSLEERVLDLLAQGRVLTRASLRDSLAVKNERLGTVLESLERGGKVGRTPSGWKRLG